MGNMSETTDERSSIAQRRLRPIAATLLFAPLLAFGVIGLPSLARAEPGMHTFRVEGGLGFTVTQPPADRFDLGGGGAVGYELRPAPWLGLEARFSAYIFPSNDSAPTLSGYGTYYAPAIGFRLHPLAPLGLPGLWMGVVGAVVWTGNVVRPGLEIGIGYEFDVAWWMQLGPFVRYQHAFQTEPFGSDGGFISAGLSFAFGGNEVAGDRDGDGILDSGDRCPDQAEDVDGYQDEDGCPDTDNDSDRILDVADHCPNDAEDPDGFEDSDGCPDIDNDHDRILDAEDRCPDQAEDLDGYQDEDGCPETDNDGDGILDAADRCPNTAETRNGFEDEDGCPDETPTARAAPAVSECQIQLNELGARIQFPRGGTRVLAGSRPALRDVVALLRAHPEVTHVRVQAYASQEGEADANMRLTEGRAETVIATLVQGGVARSRLEAEPFGETDPDVTGDTEEDRAGNRRVVFVIDTSGPVSQ